MLFNDKAFCVSDNTEDMSSASEVVGIGEWHGEFSEMNASHNILIAIMVMLLDEIERFKRRRWRIRRRKTESEMMLRSRQKGRNSTSMNKMKKGQDGARRQFDGTRTNNEKQIGNLESKEKRLTKEKTVKLMKYAR